MFKNKTVLITGGTGSWGNELVSQLLACGPKEIRILSRGEFQQVMMERRFRNKKIKFIIGDVRDRDALDYSCRGADYVFHLAALKHVPVCEEQPQEAIKTNIIGTTNLINAAIANKVKKVIDVSTDKAVDPLNLYGMTKAVAEKLVIQANKISDSTRFVCIRGGNVLGTNGSVVPYFIDQITHGNRLHVTDFRMTRFFLTLHEAIGLLFKASEEGMGGETFVMHMPACRISDLAKVLAEHYGDKTTKIVETGSRPGEKIDEVLVSRYEAPNTYKYDEHYYLILPTLEIPDLNEHYNNLKLKKVTFPEYNSALEIMDKAQIRSMLERGGFLK